MALLRSAITSIGRSPLWAPLPRGCCDHVVPPSAAAHKTTKECPEPPFGYERSGKCSWLYRPWLRRPRVRRDRVNPGTQIGADTILLIPDPIT